MADLTLFHTARVHVDTFNTLAPMAHLTHIVRPDWLERAQNGIDQELKQEITAAIAATKGPVLCSCTTIGAVAETAGATRIDWPMMQAAARTGGTVLLAYCLTSTLEPSSNLLHRACTENGHKAEIHSLDLTRLWPLFETGRTKEFAATITQAILTELENSPPIAVVVLAQASMKDAQPLLRSNLNIPVLASPETALRTLLP